MREKLIARLKTLWDDEKRRVNLLLLTGLAGLALLAVSEWLPAEAAAPAEQPLAAAQSDYAAALEDRLEALISQVEGAGQTRVMVTAASGEEAVYATDRSDGADGSSQEQHVLLGSSGAEGLVETTLPPQVLGVAVVCEGGGNAAVQLRITEIVQALTDVGASHITVAKMAEP